MRKTTTSLLLAFFAVSTALHAMPATASAQEIFVTEGGGTVADYTAESMGVSLVSGLSFPHGIAVSDGDLFVANFNSGTIGEYTTAGTPVNASLITGLNGPNYIAVSGSNLFVVNSNTDTIGEYNAATGAVENATLVSGLTNTSGIAVSGPDLFVLNSGNGRGSGTIGEYTTSGTLLNASLITGLNQPNGIAVSGSSLFVLDYPNVVSAYTGAIGEYTTLGATVNASLITTNEGEFQNPVAIAVSGSNLFVLNYGTGTGLISEFTTSGTPVNYGLITTGQNPNSMAVLPEPSSVVLAAVGFICLAVMARRKASCLPVNSCDAP